MFLDQCQNLPEIQYNKFSKFLQLRENTQDEEIQK